MEELLSAAVAAKKLGALDWVLLIVVWWMNLRIEKLEDSAGPPDD